MRGAAQTLDKLVTRGYGGRMDKRATYNFPLLCVAIDHLGGRSATARKTGRTCQAITHLYTGRNGLSRTFALALEKETARQFRAADLLGLTTSADRLP